MSIESSSSETGDVTWREIEQYVDEIDACGRSLASHDQFHQVLLGRTASALGAASGRLWTISRGQPQLAGQVERESLPADLAGQLQSSRFPQRRNVLGSDLPLITDVGNGEADARWRLLSYALRRDGEAAMVLEFVASAKHGTLAEATCRQVLTAVGSIADDFYRADELRKLREKNDLAEQCLRFSARVHRSLDLERVAGEIANELRLLLQVDRVCVLQQRRRRWRVVAVSNLAIVDRRNRTIQEIERVVAAAARYGEPLWHGPGDVEVPEVAAELSTYIDHSHVRLLGVIPLAAAGAAEVDGDHEPPGETIGALVIESFSADIPRDLREKADALSPHAGLALSNALDQANLPLRGVAVAAQRCLRLFDSKRLPRTLAVAAAALALIATLVFVRVDFTIEAEGQLQPAVTRNIYAPLDGEITEIRVQHDSAVTEGETVLVMRSAELDLLLRRLAGERAAVREQLLAAESDRIVRSPAGDGPRSPSVSSEEELRRRLDSLDKQLAIVESQRQRLELPSPIAGRVLTWEADELLAARPVRRGQVLLRVADVDSQWRLELRVADHDSGHVLSSQRESDEPLRVDFSLATQPGITYTGTVDQIAKITTLDQEGRSVVEVTVLPDDDGRISEMRPGADAMAKIHCGRRALGFVWLRDVIEFVQAKVFF